MELEMTDEAKTQDSTRVVVGRVAKREKVSETHARRERFGWSDEDLIGLDIELADEPN